MPAHDPDHERPLRRKIRESQELDLSDRKPGFWGWADAHDPLGDVISADLRGWYWQILILLIGVLIWGVARGCAQPRPREEGPNGKEVRHEHINAVPPARAPIDSGTR